MRINPADGEHLVSTKMICESYKITPMTVFNYAKKIGIEPQTIDGCSIWTPEDKRKIGSYILEKNGLGFLSEYLN